MLTDILKRHAPKTASKLMLSFGLTALVFISANDARADSFTEIEPNNSFLTGQVLTTRDGTITLNGFREAGNGLEFNDYFRFFVNAGDVLTLRVVPSNTTGDPVLRFFNSAGTLLLENDDCEDSFGLDSCIANFTITNSGLYGAGIRGIGNSTFNYVFTVNGLTPAAATAVPEPVTLLLFGSGLIAIAARKRRQKQ